MSEARALICPTFKHLAKSTRFHSDFADESDGVQNYMPWYNYSMNAYLGMKDGKWGVLKTLDVRNPAQIFSFADEGCLVKPGYFYQGLNDTALYPVWPTSEAPNWDSPLCLGLSMLCRKASCGVSMLALETRGSGFQPPVSAVRHPVEIPASTTTNQLHSL